MNARTHTHAKARRREFRRITNWMRNCVEKWVIRVLCFAFDFVIDPSSYALGLVQCEAAHSCNLPKQIDRSPGNHFIIQTENVTSKYHSSRVVRRYGPVAERAPCTAPPAHTPSGPVHRWYAFRPLQRRRSVLSIQRRWRADRMTTIDGSSLDMSLWRKRTPTLNLNSIAKLFQIEIRFRSNPECESQKGSFANETGARSRLFRSAASKRRQPSDLLFAECGFRGVPYAH